MKAVGVCFFSKKKERKGHNIGMSRLHAKPCLCLGLCQTLFIPSIMVDCLAITLQYIGDVDSLLNMHIYPKPCVTLALGQLLILRMFCYVSWSYTHSYRHGLGPDKLIVMVLCCQRELNGF